MCAFYGEICAKYVKISEPRKSILLGDILTNRVNHFNNYVHNMSVTSGIKIFVNDFIQPDSYAFENITIEYIPYSYMMYQSGTSIVNYQCPEQYEAISSSINSSYALDTTSYKNSSKAHLTDKRIIGRCLNVAGLQSKLDRGILDHYMSKADFIVFVETNTDDPLFKDTLLHDYKSFVKIKPSCPSGNYKYGGIHGICVLVNDKFHIDDCCIVENTKSECILWVNLKVDNFQFIIGATYIPCPSSRYYFDEIFEQIHEDIMYIRQKNVPFLLTGDMNAHTRTKCDYLENDYDVAKNTGCIILYNDDVENVFRNNPHCTSYRYNQDKMNVDSNGRNTISLCQSERLTIVNGRVGNDKFLGKATCFKGQPSVTDYAIASDEMFEYVIDFDVGLFDANMSDVHAPIEYVLSFETNSVIQENCLLAEQIDKDREEGQNMHYMKFRWSEEEKSNFITVISQVDVASLDKKLNDLIVSPSQEGTDSICQVLNYEIIDMA